MYNTKQLNNFIDKVNEEASAAAQAIYDKYNAELIKRVQAQIHPKDEVCNSMGASSIHRGDNKDVFVGDDFAHSLAQVQYRGNGLEACFSIPTYIYKTSFKD